MNFLPNLQAWWLIENEISVWAIRKRGFCSWRLRSWLSVTFSFRWPVGESHKASVFPFSSLWNFPTDQGRITATFAVQYLLRKRGPQRPHLLNGRTHGLGWKGWNEFRAHRPGQQAGMVHDPARPALADATPMGLLLLFNCWIHVLLRAFKITVPFAREVLLLRISNHLLLPFSSQGGRPDCSRTAVGLHLTGLRGLCVSSFKTEERAQNQQHRHQWFTGWGGFHVQRWHPTVCIRGGQGAVLAPQCKGRSPGPGETEVRWAPSPPR